MNRYSFDNFSYSGPSGILGSGGQQNTTEAGARGVAIVLLSISSHDQTVVFQYCRFSLFLKDPF